ncbi:hypothetical protein [Thauera humireducens]|uniref:hypothetical protein n=1 Tax=Thauera humireducens TaxID=1134435 RepID=UPI00311D8537
MARTFPLHTHVLALALGLVLLVGGLLAFIGQQLAGNMLSAVAEDQSLRINREVRGSLYQLVQPADMALRLLSEDALADAATLDERLRRCPRRVRRWRVRRRCPRSTSAMATASSSSCADWPARRSGRGSRRRRRRPTWCRA